MAVAKRKKKFSGQRQLIVVVDGAARDKATSYCDNENCYIATAIKQQYSGIRTVSLQSHGADINQFTYRIMGDNGGCAIIEAAVESRENLVVVLNRTKE